MTALDLDAARAALRSDLTIDIVTTGRRSGLPRTTEIWFMVVDDTVYICGTPGAGSDERVPGGGRKADLGRGVDAAAANATNRLEWNLTLLSPIRSRSRGYAPRACPTDGRKLRDPGEPTLGSG